MKTKQYGFSLIEIMVVMVIVVMLSAGGVYGWQQWQQQQRLWMTSQQIRNLLEQLRSDANWHNHDHLLTVSRTEKKWCLTSKLVVVNACGSGKRWQLLQPFADVEIAEITPGIGFYGLRNTAWPGHILLQSPAGQWHVVLSAQGRIRLCEVNGSHKCS
ncbi:prepilin peptidase-dependent protein [Buttiauxella warmboldiae]|uniref:Prepilin peptidase-dependent protein n=1 Tax=Buttiauxella warmboldiae TaxID=82993 RepID=A0A3N5DY33_9ENTR|nr:prepilin peptidase-dependent protein [Buttiauxella warmboldiae]RPH27269.1 prepilin peptidase-dependent protein [Buttiauxella warmboldiae]